MSALSRRLLALLVGSAALSVFDSSGSDPDAEVDVRSAAESAAQKERMLLMGRIGRGEISLEQAQGLYGEDLLGVTTTATPPAVEAEAEVGPAKESRAPAE